MQFMAYLHRLYSSRQSIAKALGLSREHFVNRLFVFYKFFDERGLPYAPPPVNDSALKFAARIHFIQFFEFCTSACEHKYSPLNNHTRKFATYEYNYISSRQKSQYECFKSPSISLFHTLSNQRGASGIGRHLRQVIFTSLPRSCVS